MYLLLLFLFLPETILASSICGGTYTAARGVISTPNFPKKFDTSIHCTWVINSIDHGNNTSIIVYLTQMYIMEGLKFTEYQVYDKDYKFGPKDILIMSEENVTKSTYVKSHTRYLVISLSINNIDSTHLRVLNGLLDVYGFNITYEITTGPRREDLCTMSMCGYTGNCYDHYTHFSCDCFPGYSGKHCSEGEKSLCYNDDGPVCKNGGTCMHVGDSVVKCNCKPGFEVPHCDRAKPAHNIGYEDSLISCPFDGTLENACKCPRTQKPVPFNDSIGISSRVFLTNNSLDINQPNIKEILETQITKLLRASLPKLEDIVVQVPYLQQGATDIQMGFRFYAPKKDEKRIMRNVINKWAENGAIGNYTLSVPDIVKSTDPYLHLIGVTTNKLDIQINVEFMLECEARGSETMVFRWLKDGHPFKISPAIYRKKYTQLINVEASKDHYVAILGFNKPTKWDEGVFTCQIEDYGIQQCMSKRVVLHRPPVVWLDPLSLTVNKGESFTIKCLSAWHHSKYIYSWTKDKELLKKNTDTEHYEVLYPAGSILQVSSLNKSATYSCLVQDGKLSSETKITINVIDKTIVIPCPAEKYGNYSWPETAPDTDYIHKCPKGYNGLATRSCIRLETNKPKWQLPNYMNCTPVELYETFKDFHNLMEGYNFTTSLKTLDNIASYVNRTVMLQGEGNVIIDYLTKIANFNRESHQSNQEEVAVAIFKIIDDVLDQLNSLNKDEQVLQLQMLIKSLLTTINKPSGQFFPLQLKHLIVNIEMHEHSTLTYLSNGNFNKHSTITRAVYKNLYKFISKSMLRSKTDDSNIDYEVISSIIGVWMSNSYDINLREEYNALFVHPPVTDRVEWVLTCAWAEFASSNYAWDINECLTRSINSTVALCNCSKQGTIALLLIKEPKADRHESPHPHDIIILFGCSTCLLLSSLCGILLLCNWMYHRSSFTFLKLQCCISISGAMTVFIVAFCNELPKDTYLYIVSVLQVFFFIGMSSQLSTLLIVYSELVDIQRKESIKQTVVGIITGAPLIVVFGNHLAHRTMNINLRYWWLLQGTLSFNVFISCTLIILLLFIVLYCLVVKMINGNKTSGSRFLDNRVKLIKKSSVIFYTIILLAAISIVCVNILEQIIWHYIFSATCIYMGIVILVCLVFKPQFFTKQHFLEKFHLKSNTTDNVSSSPQKSDRDREESEHAMNLHLSTSNNSDLSPSIQQYNSSPTQFNPVIKSNSLNSPDILGTKSYAQFDLVASSLQSASKIPISPMETTTNNITVAITKAFDEPIKIANETISGKVVKFCDTVQYETKVSCEHLDDVMDSISNDLNYLLNGHVELNDKTLTSHKSNCRDLCENSIPC